jgi:hypothetical protein
MVELCFDADAWRAQPGAHSPDTADRVMSAVSAQAVQETDDAEQQVV